MTDDEYDDDSSASESLAPTMEASESGVALQDVSSAGSPGPYLSGDDDDTGIDTQYAGVYHDSRKAPFVYRVCLGPAANIIPAASAVEPYYYDDDATSNNFVYDAPVAGISIKQEDGAAAALLGTLKPNEARLLCWGPGFAAADAGEGRGTDGDGCPIYVCPAPSSPAPSSSSADPPATEAATAAALRLRAQKAARPRLAIEHRERERERVEGSLKCDLERL